MKKYILALLMSISMVTVAHSAIELNAGETSSSTPYIFDAQSVQVNYPVDKEVTDFFQFTISTSQEVDGRQIQIEVSGLGDYEYALDNIEGPYQDRPVFNRLTEGTHTIYVNDKNGCTPDTTLLVSVLQFPKFFTPNGDPYNQYWNLKGWNTEYTNLSYIRIFDRYGKLLKQLNPLSTGWDGTFNLEALNPAVFVYFAEIEFIDEVTQIYKGDVTLTK